MLRKPLTGLRPARLRLWLALFFLALAIPTSVLIYQTYGQMKWEAFHRYQRVAEELGSRIESHVAALVSEGEARSFSDYGFLVVAGDPAASFLQRSPLSVYPVESRIPGLIGYFQVDARGDFSSPLLPLSATDPMAYGVSARELEDRKALADQLLQVLTGNRLVQGRDKRGLTEGMATGLASRLRRYSEEARQVKIDTEMADEAGATAPGGGYAAPSLSLEESQPSPAESIQSAQLAFDQLSKAVSEPERKKKQEASSRLGRVEDLKLDTRYQSGFEKPGDADMHAPAAVVAGRYDKRSVRKERSALPEPQAPLVDDRVEMKDRAQPSLRVTTFESEIDPLEFRLLDSGHFVLFRKVWRDGQRYVQGALIEQKPFLRGVIESAYRKTALSAITDLVVAYRGDVMAVFTGQASRSYLAKSEELRGALLYQTRLSAPLDDLQLIFSIRQLPVGSGARVIIWVAVILTLVLVVGFYLMYRLAMGQMRLARQQQDFVSAVSHELKTPLTSIRMYGEMLREGWAPEDRKKTYYDYIYDESERLSRLINNVLQLARLTRNDLRVDLKPVPVSDLVDGIRPKILSQTERAGFRLNIGCEENALRPVVRVDVDFFTQIVINLVDNAIKFSGKAENRSIDLNCRRVSGNTLVFIIRDYGPGVPRGQLKKIFNLFYRPESELTRETVGTGIGLALVHQLVAKMGGHIDATNLDPGAEFRVSFPMVEDLPTEPEPRRGPVL